MTQSTNIEYLGNSRLRLILAALARWSAGTAAAVLVAGGMLTSAVHQLIVG